MRYERKFIKHSNTSPQSSCIININNQLSKKERTQITIANLMRGKKKISYREIGSAQFIEQNNLRFAEASSVRAE